MALKSLLLLVALASSAIAQTSTPMMMPEPTTTMVADMVPSTSMTPVQTPGPAAPVTAESVQRDHFFCLGNGSSRADFVRTPSANLMANPPVYPLRWGIWLQYPVLSYLDSMRKRHLFYVISQMAQAGGVSDLFNSTCVAEVEQYGVSTYRESVFIKLYIDGYDDLDTIRMVDSAFRDSLALPVATNDYTESFQGRTAINVNSVSPSTGRTLADRTVNDSVHPGCDIVSCPEGDPTLLAVVIGTYVGQAYYGPYSSKSEEGPEEVTIENLERGISSDIGTFYSTSEFANNPRPINYGLEAGDIVFAVFGSIFLTILSGAIILGFVIHPFCLA